MSQATNGFVANRASAPAEVQDKRQFVTFALGEQLYCVDIMSVREIRVSNVITALPGAPDFVRGVINLRGTIVPVCDLRSRFGQGKTELTGNNAVVIVAINDRLTGLLVDEVCDILTASDREFSAIPETDSNRRNPFFHGLITQADSMLIVVSLERLTESFASSGHAGAGAATVQ